MREIHRLFQKVFGSPLKEKIFFWRPPSPAKKNKYQGSVHLFLWSYFILFYKLYSYYLRLYYLVLFFCIRNLYFSIIKNYMIYFLTIYDVTFLINIFYKNYKATQKHLFGMTQLTQKQP